MTSEKSTNCTSQTWPHNLGHLDGTLEHQNATQGKTLLLNTNEPWTRLGETDIIQKTLSQPLSLANTTLSEDRDETTNYLYWN
jgi:hypothetical protein